MAENNLGNTQYFRTKPDQELEVKEVLDLVYNAMDEKGYNPVNQIVGYIMSGDPVSYTHLDVYKRQSVYRMVYQKARERRRFLLKLLEKCKKWIPVWEILPLISILAVNCVVYWGSSCLLYTSRSLMNVPFVTGDKEMDAKFVKEASEAGLVNLKGHRSVGGMRASIYNAMPKEGVEALVDFMKKFEEANA